MSEIPTFKLAGAELDWPIGTAAGMSNHPDIEVVARRFEGLVALGVGEAVLGSVKLGLASGGNAHVQQPDGSWDYLGGDEYVEVDKGIGHNSKGLPGPGVDSVLERIDDFIDLGRAKNTEVSLSISPHTQDPLSEIPELLEAARKALKAGVLRVEFNLSCPNVPERPAFYLDIEAVRKFITLVDDQKDSLRNRFNHPGVTPKFGPMGKIEKAIDEGYLRGDVSLAMRKGIFGGTVTSNTILGEGVPKEDGGNEITVNNGKAGQSGPYFEEIGRNQLDRWLFSQVPTQRNEIISVLGISTGTEVLRRLNLGASFCQLASVIYWPELAGGESAKAVVEKIRYQFIQEIETARPYKNLKPKS
jgi:dihydroorotate dehydrogenase